MFIFNFPKPCFFNFSLSDAAITAERSENPPGVVRCSGKGCRLILVVTALAVQGQALVLRLAPVVLVPVFEGIVLPCVR